MVYQMDIEFRAPYPDTDDGYYYWTNTWYSPKDTDSAAFTSFLRMQTWIAARTTTDCQRVKATFKRSPGPGGVYFTQNLLNFPGTYPAGTEGYTLLGSARIRFYSEGRLAGYKRWRMPIRNDQVVGDRLDPALIAHLADGWAPILPLGHMCNVNGLVIDAIEVDPLIHKWQLRHGTKRRSRVVIA